MKYLAAVLAILAVYYFRSYDAGTESATRRGDEWLFKAGRLLRWIVLYGFGATFLLGLRTLFSDQASEQLFGILFALVAFPLYLFLLPRTIIVSPGGLDWRGWLYQRHSIPWKSIVRAASIPATKKILIYDDGGVVATHTRYHSGRSELIALLRKNQISIS
jgi:hypothetical protein